MGGPEMAPHTPQRSGRPGEAVAALYSHTLIAGCGHAWVYLFEFLTVPAAGV